MIKKLLLLFCIFAGHAFAQTVPVSANLTNGSGAIVPGAYLHFALWNCGVNVPSVSGTGSIVQSAFDMKQPSGGGTITGVILANDQILCGGIASTRWLVTPMSPQGQPITNAQRYNICSASALRQSCSQPTGAGGTFDPSTAQSDTAIAPSPGWSMIFGNPSASQTITQPAGTSMNFYGSFFLNGNPLSGGGGGGSMTWPSSTGVVVYSGPFAWGSSLSYGTGANALLQLNSSGAIPAVSGANITGLNVAQVTGAAPLSSPSFTGNGSITGSFSTGLGFIGNLSGNASTASNLAGAAYLPGGVAGVTQATADNSTLLATDQWVKNQAYATLASPTFTVSVVLPSATTGVTQTAGDTSTEIATDQFVSNSFAPLASPTLTGVPTAPTATGGTNTTQIATTAFVQNSVSAGGDMVYPPTGIPSSSGSAWGSSYGVGTSANNLVQLNSSAQLPAVSGVNLTGLTASQVGLSNVTNNAQTQAAVVPNTAPAAGQDLVGNAGGTAYAPVTMSGDCTRASTGAITCTKSNTVPFGTGAFATIANYAPLTSPTFVTSVTLPGTLPGTITVTNATGSQASETSRIYLDQMPATDVTLDQMFNDANARAITGPYDTIDASAINANKCPSNYSSLPNICNIASQAYHGQLPPPTIPTGGLGSGSTYTYTANNGPYAAGTTGGVYLVSYTASGPYIIGTGASQETSASSEAIVQIPAGTACGTGCSINITGPPYPGYANSYNPYLPPVAKEIAVTSFTVSGQVITFTASGGLNGLTSSNYVALGGFAASPNGALNTLGMEMLAFSVSGNTFKIVVPSSVNTGTLSSGTGYAIQSWQEKECVPAERTTIVSGVPSPVSITADCGGSALPLGNNTSSVHVIPPKTGLWVVTDTNGVRDCGIKSFDQSSWFGPSSGLGQGFKITTMGSTLVEAPWCIDPNTKQGNAYFNIVGMSASIGSSTTIATAACIPRNASDTGKFTNASCLGSAGGSSATYPPIAAVWYYSTTGTGAGFEFNGSFDALNGPSALFGGLGPNSTVNFDINNITVPVAGPEFSSVNFISGLGSVSVTGANYGEPGDFTGTGTVDTQNASSGACAGNCVLAHGGTGTNFNIFWGSTTYTLNAYGFSTTYTVEKPTILIGPSSGGAPTPYTVASVQSATLLTLTTPPGTQSGQSWWMGCVDPLQFATGIGPLPYANAGGWLGGGIDISNLSIAGCSKGPSGYTVAPSAYGRYMYSVPNTGSGFEIGSLQVHNIPTGWTNVWSDPNTNGGETLVNPNPTKPMPGFTHDPVNPLTIFTSVTIGGTLSVTGKTNTAASTTSSAGLNCAPGSAPSSPVNGDIWCTSAGIYVRVNGTTVGPLVANASSVINASELQAVGTPATISGTGACATQSTQTGGAWAGSFKCTGSTGTGSVTITPGFTANNSLVCGATDVSGSYTTSFAFVQTNTSSTSCQLSSATTSITSGDTILFWATAF